MKRLAILALALLVTGCTTTPTPSLDRLTPYAIAFWDEQHGLLAGQAGCPAACADYVIAATQDGGRHWQVVHQSLDRITNLATVHGGAWASTAKGLYKSEGSGKGWTLAAPGKAEPSFIDANTGWALAATDENRSNVDSPIYVTQDGGKAWARINSPCGAMTPAAISLVSKTEGWVGCVGQPGAGQQLKVLYRTTDGGGTWTQIETIGGGGYLSGLFFRPGGKGWVWRNRGGLSVTTDGAQTWNWPSITQAESKEAWDLWMVTDQTGYLIIRDNDARQFKLVKTTDGGQTARLITEWPID